MLDSLEKRKERAELISAKLTELFPDASIALKHGSNWELLVAVMLSAQCTDKQVNIVTEKLFKKYRILDDYLNATIMDFEQNIKSCGFFHNKTKNILATARLIKEKFDGEVPTKMKDLLSLPGIARKTANIVLGNAYGIVEGIAVDTHVRRFALKMGLSDSFKNTDKIEQDLMQIFPKEEWFPITYRIIEYGRQICPARKHPCEKHPLSQIYPPAANIWP